MKFILIFLIGLIAGGIVVSAFLKNFDPPSRARSPGEVIVPKSPAIPAPPVAESAPAASTVESTKPTTGFVKKDGVATNVPSDDLFIPVAGIKAAQLSDTFDQARGSERHHEALDIMAPKGTEVLAVADGKIVKLFNSKPGGITLYQFDRTEKFAYYYAHLDRYAAGIVEGTMVKRGDLLGYVGSTGNADPVAPHLHFAIFELGPEKQWWKGTPINPYPLLGGLKRP